ncbi:hypothetical protein Tsubulata_014226 [Turnera subulata]|uniref:DUF4283 domain-containing protein n=1 Tax=Turnera subulata TaxID=218843 RepID=A0A9Q0FP60_9ROSI|nr:hypothetical protein Tsubulata_014226 [Turnera subulata]
MPSAPILDSSGQIRKRSSIVMDLTRLDGLLNATSLVSQSLKGKNVASSLIVPLSAPEVSSSLPTSVVDHQQARVPLEQKINFGISVSEPSLVIFPAGDSSTTPSWTSIVENKVVQPLQFVQPIFADNIIQILSQILAIGRKKYSLCLVGQFMGTSPKMGLIQAVATKLWGRQSPVSAVAYAEGLYLLQFADEASLARALYGCPWHIGVPEAKSALPSNSLIHPTSGDLPSISRDVIASANSQEIPINPESQLAPKPTATNLINAPALVQQSTHLLLPLMK